MKFYKYSLLLIVCCVSLFNTGRAIFKKILYQAFLLNDAAKWEKVTYNYEKCRFEQQCWFAETIHCYYGYIFVLIDKDQDKRQLRI